MPVDFLGVAAIVLGVMFALRKLDAKGRRAVDQPSVAKADFERWQNAATSAYGLGSTACFLRVIFHFVWFYYAIRNQVSFEARRAVALSMDVLWLSCLGLAFFRARSARKLREELGIRWGAPKT